MEQGDSLHLSDIPLPEGVRVTAVSDEALAILTAPAAEEEPAAAEGEAAAAAEGEAAPAEAGAGEEEKKKD